MRAKVEFNLVPMAFCNAGNMATTQAKSPPCWIVKDHGYEVGWSFGFARKQESAHTLSWPVVPTLDRQKLRGLCIGDSRGKFQTKFHEKGEITSNIVYSASCKPYCMQHWKNGKSLALKISVCKPWKLPGECSWSHVIVCDFLDFVEFFSQTLLENLSVELAKQKKKKKKKKIYIYIYIYIQIYIYIYIYIYMKL